MSFRILISFILYFFIANVIWSDEFDDRIFELQTKHHIVKFVNDNLVPVDEDDLWIKSTKDFISKNSSLYKIIKLFTKNSNTSAFFKDSMYKYFWAKYDMYLNIPFNIIEKEDLNNISKKTEFLYHMDMASSSVKAGDEFTYLINEGELEISFFSGSLGMKFYDVNGKYILVEIHYYGGKP